jgi:hypothetical protein
MVCAAAGFLLLRHSVDNKYLTLKLDLLAQDPESFFSLILHNQVKLSSDGSISFLHLKL